MNRQVMDKTQELAKTKYDDATLEKVRFCIVHQVVSVLEEF